MVDNLFVLFSVVIQESHGESKHRKGNKEEEKKRVNVF
jgi:hypothetical protein